jgi:hypothetical protein
VRENRGFVVRGSERGGGEDRGAKRWDRRERLGEMFESGTRLSQ